MLAAKKEWSDAESNWSWRVGKGVRSWDKQRIRADCIARWHSNQSSSSPRTVLSFAVPWTSRIMTQLWMDQGMKRYLISKYSRMLVIESRWVLTVKLFSFSVCLTFSILKNIKLWKNSLRGLGSFLTNRTFLIYIVICQFSTRLNGWLQICFPAASMLEEYQMIRCL